jgi:hypothetical protein
VTLRLVHPVSLSRSSRIVNDIRPREPENIRSSAASPFRRYSGEGAYRFARARILRIGLKFPALGAGDYQLSAISYWLSVIGLWPAWIGTAATKFHLPQP